MKERMGIVRVNAKGVQACNLPSHNGQFQVLLTGKKVCFETMPGSALYEKYNK